MKRSKDRANDLPINIEGTLKERLKRYDDLNMLEEFAMYMGKVQLLELGLKNLLSTFDGYDLEEMDRWTLGRTNVELKKVGIRPDFLSLLKGVVDSRNYIAHEFLASEAILRNLVGETGRLEYKHLQKGIFELEQIIIWYDLCHENDAWLGEPPIDILKT